MPKEARDSATFLLKAGSKFDVAKVVYIEIFHLDIHQRIDRKSLIVITHEPGGKKP
jgi:hypothetical protein